MVQRRKFSKEFKLESVNLVLGRGVSLAQAARDLDINESVLSRDGFGSSSKASNRPFLVTGCKSRMTRS